eukprot:COSAG01_NODE_39668_length_473_cov_1.355615_2_plen_53_part_00
MKAVAREGSQKELMEAFVEDQLHARASMHGELAPPLLRCCVTLWATGVALRV